MTVHEAREYLEQFRKIDELIKAKNEERRRLLLIATDCSAKLPDGMPFNNTGVTSRSFENAVIKLIELAEEIDKAIARMRKIRAEITTSLEKLPANEYGVLHRHYIQYKTWEQIAEEMSKSTRQIYRIRDNGLKILANVIECHI